MVYFICNNCGESLKKPQVDQHLGKLGGFSRCRNCSVSCMDCSRDFDSITYVLHTKCITEQEKYSGGNFQMKASTVNKQDKRSKWLDLIRTVATRNDPARSKPVQKLLDFLADKETVPNKEKAFKNFMNGVPVGVRNTNAGNVVWALLNKERNLEVAEAPAQTNENKNQAINGSQKNEKINEEEKPIGTSKYDVWKSAMKKLSKSGGPYAATFKVLAKQSDVPMGPRKTFKAYVKKLLPETSSTSSQVWSALKVEIDSVGKDTTDEVTNGSGKRKISTENGLELSAKKVKITEEQVSIKMGKLPWKKTVQQVLTSSKDNSLSMKKLKKKVLAEFQSSGQLGADLQVTDEKFCGKLSKAISKLPNIVINNDSKEKVMLIMGD